MIKLICGLPRAGKTTYSSFFQDIQVIHLDNFLGNPYNGVLRKIKKIKDDIVVQGVYNKKQQRMKLLHEYKGEGKHICIWINTIKEIRMNRENYDKFCDFPFEPPTYDQGWDQIIIIENNDKETILEKPL